jgi:hypothetical protein
MARGRQAWGLACCPDAFVRALPGPRYRYKHRLIRHGSTHGRYCSGACRVSPA